MKIGKTTAKRALLPLSVAFLCACASPKIETVKVLLEDGEYHCQNQSKILAKGSDFTFSLTLSIDKIVTGASYSNYTLNERIEGNYRYQDITFHHVEYSTLIHLDISQAIQITYRCGEESKTEYTVKTHERINVSNDYSTYEKDGYAFYGWKQGEDTVSLGSRVNVNEDVVLDALLGQEEDVSMFETEILDASRIAIKKYKGHSTALVVPKKIENRNVVVIQSGAFSNLEFATLVLPRTLNRIENDAFNNCDIDEFVFFDNLSEVSDASFVSTNIRKMRINAIKGPAYIRTYFGTYADKMDRLISLQDQKKILLYSGSSTRFGFDSEAIDKTFLDYDVVNLGVFAYGVSYPQIDLFSNFLEKDDIVIVSPEFDAIEEQIHLLPVFDWSTFALCESNYDLLSLLDISSYEHVFDAYKEYQYRRNSLPRYSYQDTPYQYDEDENYHKTPTYNAYGDYSLYRENNISKQSFGVKRAYYNKTHFPKDYLDCFNAAFSSLKEKQARFYYDYSPRMNISISEDSTSESILELGTYLEENIDMEFISSIEDSLMDPLYFYGTDNHLSTEGASLRTERVIQALSDRMDD